MRRLFREREIHGVKVLYIENQKVRVAQKVYPTGRGVWALLPDGRVGCNDLMVFKYAYVGTQRRDVIAAEAMWRLGAIKKGVFEKVQATEKKHRTKCERGYAIDEFKRSAQKLGIKLTAEQVRVL